MSSMIAGTAADFIGEGDRNPERPLYDVTLSVAGEQIGSHRERCTFNLVTPENETIEVITDASTQLIAHDEETAPWGELLGHPFAPLFEREAPGDHVEVTLAWTLVQPGDRVAVLGIEEGALAKGGGYRGSHDVVRTVKASALAVGDAPEVTLAAWEREQRTEEPTPAPRSSAKPASRAPKPKRAKVTIIPQCIALAGGLSLAVLAFRSIGSTFNPAEGQPVSVALTYWALAVPILAASIYWIRNHRFIPSFVPLSTRMYGDRGSPIGGMAVPLAWIVALPPLAGLLAALAATVGPFLAIGIVLSVAALVPLRYTVHLYRREAPDARTLRVLLRAPEYRPGIRGSSTLEMDVERAKVVRKRRDWYEQVQVRPRRYAWKMCAWAKTGVFSVSGRAKSGAAVRVDSNGAHFASLVRSTRRVRVDEWMHNMDITGMSPEQYAQAMIETVQTMASNESAHAEQSEDEDKHITHEVITPGTSLLVLGRFREEYGVLTAASSGPESLVLFGADRNARASARRALVLHYVSVGSLALLTIGTLAAGWLGPLLLR